MRIKVFAKNAGDRLKKSGMIQCTNTKIKLGISPFSLKIWLLLRIFLKINACIKRINTEKILNVMISLLNIKPITK